MSVRIAIVCCIGFSFIATWATHRENVKAKQVSARLQRVEALLNRAMVVNDACATNLQWHVQETIRLRWQVQEWKDAYQDCFKFMHDQ